MRLRKLFPVWVLTAFLLIALSMPLKFAGICHAPSPALAADEEEAEKDKTEEKDVQDGEKDAEGQEEAPAEEKEASSEDVKIMLDGLEDKRKALQQWEADLAARQKKLEQLKGETEEKIEKNTALLKKIEAAITSLEDKKTKKELEAERLHEAEMAKLVKLYSGMKPQNAATIVNKMDLEVAKDLFSRMKGAKAAKILSFTDTDRAARISERLAAKKR